MRESMQMLGYGGLFMRLKGWLIDRLAGSVADENI
jgi:hypothetical protein